MRVVYDGGVFLGPIFGDMLVTANQCTQVRVDGPPKVQVVVSSVSVSSCFVTWTSFKDQFSNALSR